MEENSHCMCGYVFIKSDIFECCFKIWVCSQVVRGAEENMRMKKYEFICEFSLNFNYKSLFDIFKTKKHTRLVFLQNERKCKTKKVVINDCSHENKQNLWYTVFGLGQG